MTPTHLKIIRKQFFATRDAYNAFRHAQSKRLWLPDENPQVALINATNQFQDHVMALLSVLEIAFVEPPDSGTPDRTPPTSDPPSTIR